MRKKFLSNPDYNFAKINNASTACGPMVKWAIAQVRVPDPLHMTLLALGIRMIGCLSVA